VLAVLIHAGACWAWCARPARRAEKPELAEVLPLPRVQHEAELDLAA